MRVKPAWSTPEGCHEVLEIEAAVMVVGLGFVQLLAWLVVFSV